MSKNDLLYSDTSANASEENREIPGNGHIARFFVFQGDSFIGQDCFTSKQVLIGQGKDVDLVLPTSQISGIQACVYFKGDRIYISDRSGDNNVLVNGRPAKEARLRPLDFVDIGPYTLKIKIEKVENRYIDPAGNDETVHDNEAERVPRHRENHSSSNVDREAAFHGDPAHNDAAVDTGSQSAPAAQSKALSTDAPDPDIPKPFRKKIPSAAKMLDRFRKSLGNSNKEEPLSDVTAKQIKDEPKPDGEQKGTVGIKALESSVSEDASNESVRDDTSSAAIAGNGEKNSVDQDSVNPAGPEMEAEPLEKEESDLPATMHNDSETEENQIPQSTPDTEPAKSSLWPYYGMALEDDEEDDEDVEAEISLRERITAFRSSTTGDRETDKSTQMVLEVVKFRGDSVIDARFLNKKDRYHIKDHKGRRFCLAEVKASQRYFFYFDHQRKGLVKKENNTEIDTDALATSLRPFKKRKGIYRDIVPSCGEVVINDGYFQYLLRKVPQTKPPAIAHPAKEKSKRHKHLLTSIVFHVFFIAFLGLVPSFSPDKSEIDETRFVHLDETQMAELAKLAKPVPKPQVSPPVKPKPKPKAKAKPKPKPKPQLAKKKTTKPAPKPKKSMQVAEAKKKTNTVKKPSRHPDAGGGFGKGNVANRDIKKTGILSLIGDNVGFQPQAAIASVTNLDAVTVPDAGDADFTVGGVVGKLGTGKIEVPTTGIVATKGSKQVLRSAGASGPGRIAALEKGETGNNQVMGMVTANLEKSVKVQGGMSRQAVKRVIDQHLDEISYCYETALIYDPSIMGKVIFEWKILMDGEVGEVRIKFSSINSDKIHSCIKTAIKSWQFPSPKGAEVMVSYPFIFDIVGF